MPRPGAGPCLPGCGAGTARRNRLCFWSREANKELLGLVDDEKEPEPTVAAIEAALGRGAEPNTALEWVMDDGLTVRRPALALLALSYDRADCVCHCSFCAQWHTDSGGLPTIER